MAGRPARGSTAATGSARSRHGCAIGSSNHVEGHRAPIDQADPPWSREDRKTVRRRVFPSGGQVERMLRGFCKQTPASQPNRTIREATVKRSHHDDHDQLRNHLALFIDADNNTRRRKTRKGPTPAQFIRRECQAAPETFIPEPCR